MNGKLFALNSFTRNGLKKCVASTMQREVILLSSSPIPSAHQHRTSYTDAVPSSPHLPPLNHVFKAPKPSILRTGSQSKSIPETAPLGFQSTLSLPLQSIESDKSDLLEERAPKKKRGRPPKDPNAPPKTRKPRTKKTAASTDKKAATVDVDNEIVDVTIESTMNRRKSRTPPPVIHGQLEANDSFKSLSEKLSELRHLDATSTESALSKRKRAEIDHAAQNQVAEKETPKLSPVKKPKTITGFALDKFEGVEHQLKELEKSKSKKSKAAERSRKIEVEAKLLSPQSVANNLEQQALMFGTSSQLAGVTSATYLQQMQQALIESALLNQAVKTPVKKFRTAKAISGGSMWNAGALHSDDAVIALTANDEFKHIDDFSSPVEEPVQIKSPSMSESIVPQAIPTEKTAKAPLNAGISTIPMKSPAKKPRGRPRKEPKKVAQSNVMSETMNSSVSAVNTVGLNMSSLELASSKFMDIDEIEDSDPETPLSPLLLQTTNTSSLPLVVSPSKTSKATRYGSKVDWDTVKTGLFSEITNVVTSTAKPSSTNSKLSWYERMLMYEPIVLGDFTAWLIDQGVTVKLADGSKEDELLPWMVQKWCETKSVCCRWKPNIRRTARSKA